MKKDLSCIACIIDRSGSMQPLVDDTIGGFNTFLDSQKAVPGEAKLTLVTFANDIDSKPLTDLTDIQPLTTEQYQPSGGTALLDAIGETIDKLGLTISEMAEDDRPEHIIVAILTDGEENASKRFTRKDIFDKITHQTETYNWDFMFLAANQDAIAAGGSLGVKSSSSFNFTADAAGTRDAYLSMSSYSTNSRTCKAAP